MDGIAGRDTQISIHAPLAGCDVRVGHFLGGDAISIHAPLAGCDLIKAGYRVQMRISIHAPLAGCDKAT